MYNVGIYKYSFLQKVLSRFAACANAFDIFPQCTYISKHKKKQKKTKKTILTNSTKKTRYNVVLIVFDGDPCDGIVYTVTVSYHCITPIGPGKNIHVYWLVTA